MKIGQRVRYDPLAYMCGHSTADVRQEVVGTVVYINESHGWFLTEYNGIRTGYRMDDIGLEVKE